MKRQNTFDTLTRRDALRFLLGSTAVAVGCGGSGADLTGDAAASSGSDAASAGDASECTATPEGEIGPYFADDSDPRFNRSNILSNLDGSSTQTGIPLTLSIRVVDSEKSCAPYAGAQVDIWHCNSSGIYSDQASESTSSEQWLRGYQITDSNGMVSFTTIVPGWYQGRTTHIHLRIRSSYSSASSTSDGTNTTQLFFDQSLVDTIDTTIAPYASEGKNTTTNASDRVYSDQEHGANQLALSGDSTAGYVAAVTIYLPITDDATGTTTTGGNGPPDGGMGGGPPDGGMGGGAP